MSKALTIETVSEAVRYSWKYAHKANNWKEKQHRWFEVRSELSGIWNLILYSDGSDELMDDVKLLEDIARENTYS